MSPQGKKTAVVEIFRVSEDCTFHRLSAELGIVLGVEARHIVRGKAYVDVFSLASSGLAIDKLIHRKSLQDQAEVFLALEQARAVGFITTHLAQQDPPSTPTILELPFSICGSERLIFPCADSESAKIKFTEKISDRLEALGCICIVADTYLDPNLLEVIRAQRKDELVCLIKVLGAEVWIGPIAYSDNQSWEEIFKRIRDNFPAEQYVASRTGHAPVGARRAMCKSVDELCNLLLQELPPEAIISGTTLSATPHIVTINYVTRVRHVHCVPVKPHSANAEDVDTLSIRATDGGRRSCSAESLIAAAEPFVDSITGLIPMLNDIDTLPGANVTTATQVFPNSHLLKENRRIGLRMAAAGKGETRAQARASCIGEAIERYSACFQGNESTLKTSMRRLGVSAIDPRSLMLFSKKQYVERDWWNTHHGFFHHVPKPFDETDLLSWVRCERIGHSEIKLVPASYVYFNFADSVPDEPRTCIADSNGCAAGNSIKEAQLQGLYELIERDACAIWWYNKLQFSAIDAGEIESEFVQRSPSRYQSYGRTLSLREITSDLGIPVILAFTHKPDGTSICVGLGCHSDVNVAASRAVAELDQFVAMFGLDVLNRFHESGNRELDSWLRNEAVEDHAYFSAGQNFPNRLNKMALPSTIEGELANVVNIVEEKIGPVYYIDLSRAEAPLKAVRVLVPQMRHFWARFGPGRLFDAPIRMGKFSRKLNEGELNAIPFFL